MAWIKAFAGGVVVLGVLNLVGCTNYVAPGRGADVTPKGLQEMRMVQGEASIERLMALKPLAQFPTAIAVVRVQSSGYRSYSISRSYGNGAFSVVTERDVEKDEQFERLAAMPMVKGVAPVSRLMLPTELGTDEPLRAAAARLGADLLLIYTIDTTFSTEDNAKPLSVLTLGLMPGKMVRVSTTASAILIDTRNGYVYGAAEATEKTKQLTNAWQNREAIDQSRRRAESAAFESLVKELEKTWAGVVRTYGGGSPAASAR